MSRLAKFPVKVPDGVTVSVAPDGAVSVKGGLGELSMPGDGNVAVTVDGQSFLVRRTRETKHARSMEGTFVRRIANMATGVSDGCSKSLELHGTGYRASLQGRTIDLELGYSHRVTYDLPDGVEAELPSQTQIVIKGTDKALVGQVAAEIRKARPPEPYKGKGARYVGEQLNMKETKKK